jgi:hypothetical protein
MSDDELRRIREAVEGIEKSPSVQWTGAGATDKLHETIKQFNEVATPQTGWLVLLTWVIAGLTFLLVVGLGVQIGLAICSTR